MKSFLILTTSNIIKLKNKLLIMHIMGSIKILNTNLFLHMIVLSMLQVEATMQTEKTFQTCLSALDAVGGQSHLELE